jgi:hypothetical protein
MVPKAGPDRNHHPLLNRGSGHISGLSFGCCNLRAQKPLRGNFCQNNKAGFIRQPQAG